MGIYIFKNVKNRFRVALKSMEARKSQLCPLHIRWALAKSYGDLFNIPNHCLIFAITKFFFLQQGY